MKKLLLLLIIPLLTFNSCEEEEPEDMLMNNCGTVNLAMDYAEIVEYFNGPTNDDFGCGCAVYQSNETVSNIRCWLSLYNDSGDKVYQLSIQALKEYWGEPSLSNPFVPYMVGLSDYTNLAVYECESSESACEEPVSYNINYINQTISGEFDMYLPPWNQSQNNPINISGNFSDVPFILYVQ
tara:strand:+ start:28 stop:573 length:546 start_codon:yes stop_codon:yes gene_type:complete